MKRFLFLLLLIGVVFFAGCTGGGGGGTNDGIVITSFYADPSEVEGGDHIYVLMDIENRGGDVARGIQVRLIGLPTGATGFSGNFDNPDGLPTELYPPETGTAGEPATLEWDLIAPESQTDITYPAEGLIEYSYASHVESLVALANRDWLRSLPPDKRKSESDKQGTVSGGIQNGPIHATIKPSTSTGSRLILDIQNVGSGTLKNNEIRTVKVTGMTCSKLSSPVRMIRGESKQFRCEPTESPTEQERWKNIRIDVDLEYDYSVSRTIDIRVLKTPLP